jgi:hypothetical protein
MSVPSGLCMYVLLEFTLIIVPSRAFAKSKCRSARYILRLNAISWLSEAFFHNNNIFLFKY